MLEKIHKNSLPNFEQLAAQAADLILKLYDYTEVPLDLAAVGQGLGGAKADKQIFTVFYERDLVVREISYCDPQSSLMPMDDPRDSQVAFSCEICGKRLVPKIGQQDVLFDIGFYWHIPCVDHVSFLGSMMLVGWNAKGRLIPNR